MTQMEISQNLPGHAVIWLWMYKQYTCSSSELPSAYFHIISILFPYFPRHDMIPPLPKRKSHSCTDKKTFASKKATTSMSTLWKTAHNRITVYRLCQQLSCVLDDYIHNLTLYYLQKTYTSEITYIYHGQKVAFNTMALFIKTCHDQLGHDLYITACIKRHENTFTNIYG